MRKVCKFLLAAVFVPAICGQTGDAEREIGSRAAAFFGAMQRRDLGACLSFWQSDSQALVPTREELRQLFATSGSMGVGVTSLTTAVAGSQARSHADIEIQVTGQRSGSRRRSEKSVLIDWILADNVWKILRYAPIEEELADALFAAADAAERQRLREQSPRLVDPELVQVLSQQGLGDAKQARFDDGLRRSDIAIEVAATMADPAAMAWAKLRRGSMLMIRSDYKAARLAANESLSGFQSVHDRAGEAAARNALAAVDLREAKYNEASDEITITLRIARALGDPQLEARALGYSGEVQRLQHGPAGALPAFLRSLDLATEAGSRELQADEKINIGNIRSQQANFTEAKRLYSEALEIDLDLADRPREAVSRRDVCIALDAAGNRRRAAEFCDAALRAARDVGDLDNQGSILLDQAVIAYENLALDDAQGLCDKALEISQRLGTPSLEAEIRNHLGLIRLRRGQYKESLEFLLKAAAMARKIGKPVSEAQFEGNAALVYHLTGDLDAALSSFQRILSLFIAEGMQLDAAITLNNIGVIYQTRGLRNRDYRIKAIQAFERSLVLRNNADGPMGSAGTRTNLVALYFQEGRFKDALATAQKILLASREVGPALVAVNTLLAGVNLQLLRRTQEAEEQYRAGLEKAQGLQAPPLIAMAYTGLGTLATTQRRWEIAADYCGRAISEIEKARTLVGDTAMEMGVFERLMGPYECRVNALAMQGQFEEALRVSEASKSRSLVELLENSNTDIHKGLSTEEEQSLTFLDSSVASIKTAMAMNPGPVTNPMQAFGIALASQGRDNAHLALYEKHPLLRVQRGDAEPLTDEQLGKLVPDDRTGLIEYFIGESHSWIFVVRRGSGGRAPSITGRPLNIQKGELSNHVANFIEWIRADNQAEEIAEARGLYDRILAPVSNELRGAKVLGIVPDGDLWVMPFAALRKPSGQSGRLLLHDVAIFAAPSLVALYTMIDTRDHVRRETGSLPLKALLVGNPYLDDQLRARFEKTRKLPDLKGAEKEVGTSRRFCRGPMSLWVRRPMKRASAAKPMRWTFCTSPATRLSTPEIPWPRGYWPGAIRRNRTTEFGRPVK